MKELERGHRYLLPSLDDNGGFMPVQQLIFVSRVGKRYPGNVNAYPGTTSQDVLRALVARAIYVNGQIPCKETRLSIWLMRAVIFLYEWRAKRVKGHRLPLSAFRRIETMPVCGRCGHILCTLHSGDN